MALKNPNWCEPELLLAASLVHANGFKALDKSDPRVIRLSILLKKANFHSVDLRLPNFRSPSSVARKTQNIADTHPSFVKTKSHGSKGDAIALQTFLTDPQRADAEVKKIIGQITEG